MSHRTVLMGSLLLASALIFTGCSDEKKEEKKVEAQSEKTLLPVEFIEVKKEKIPHLETI